MKRMNRSDIAACLYSNYVFWYLMYREGGITVPKFSRYLPIYKA